ncbi:hypothetical protein SeLEV6574_g02095 [Synchytrium endobioticum]|uniref:Uncharacterized protein n=1 Tax=Synchytrium endobioticum TaxID=286115 RepID=A0A507D9X4_9FUNG|nr:hypothetical protein SeLEV6574_g02078 [Synchytrium endobioticum]TPX48344.1 hypothetical protein SeLEV6574_g02095 [Synchytrium endobioticum]
MPAAKPKAKAKAKPSQKSKKKPTKADDERLKRLDAVSQLKTDYITACKRLGVDVLPSVQKAISDAQTSDLSLNKG